VIIGLKDNWKDAQTPHTAYLENIINDFKNRRVTLAPALIDKFVADVERWVISDRRDDLERAADHLDNVLETLSDADQEQLLAELGELFNYTYFTQKKKTIWNAYNLCALSKFRVCPYCHHSYAFTLHRDKMGLLRPTLDHYYAKSDYPHLALTLTNLIPSCYTCNSTLKGSINFRTKKHLHPLFDDEDVSFRCSAAGGTIVKTVSFLDSQRSSLTLSVKATSAAAINSMDTFALRERYELLEKEGIDFAIAQLQTRELIENLSVTNGTAVKLDPRILKARLLRFVPEDYREYLLGKLYLDLDNQFRR